MEPGKEETVDLMMGFFRTKVITAALELRVFDALKDGPGTSETISRKLEIPEHAGKRLLIALCALGLLRREGDGFALTQTASDYLVSDSPQWLGWLARHIDQFLYPLWNHTAEAVRSGTDQRRSVFGDDRSWFDILYDYPDDVADFQRFLGIFADPFIQGLVNGYDFSRHKRFLDIGSGIGTLPMCVADRYSDLEIAICELPQAARFARDELARRGYADRIRVIEGDLIGGNLPNDGYDLVHLGWTLHDYAINTQERILANIYRAMPPGGVFMASETPLDDNLCGPPFVALLSVNMLVSTDGGIESTKGEYLHRFQQAGFVNVGVVPIDGPRTLLVGEKPDGGS